MLHVQYMFQITTSRLWKAGPDGSVIDGDAIRLFFIVLAFFRAFSPILVASSRKTIFFSEKSNFLQKKNEKLTNHKHVNNVLTRLRD